MSKVDSGRRSLFSSIIGAKSAKRCVECEFNGEKGHLDFFTEANMNEESV